MKKLHPQTHLFSVFQFDGPRNSAVTVSHLTTGPTAGDEAVEPGLLEILPELGLGDFGLEPRRGAFISLGSLAAAHLGQEGVGGGHHRTGEHHDQREDPHDQAQDAQAA